MELIRLVIYFSIYLGLVTTTFFMLSYKANKKKEIIKPLKDDELPIVSILIPAYNEEKGIIPTIKSALSLNYPKNKLEIIVIDDGSKDKTLELARSIKNPIIKVLTKKNEGKASALNLGISKARGEIIITMDADTIADKNSVKYMVAHFQDKNVAAVGPSMVTTKPKTIAQRIQYLDYVMGLFARKVFSGLDSIYVSPGAFSAYRKSFFEKYGGYEVGNITEDLEISLRIQYNHFKIKNCPEAVAYTIAPSTFKELAIQRRRWYVGLLKNTIRYRKLFSKEYGDLGVVIFPLVWIGTLITIIMSLNIIFSFIKGIIKEINLLKIIEFDLINSTSINLFVIKRFLFAVLSDPIFWFVLVFLTFYVVYMKYASDKIGKLDKLWFNFPIFFLLFSIFYGFWWLSSLIYALFHREIKWR